MFVYAKYEYRNCLTKFKGNGVETIGVTAHYT